MFKRMISKVTEEIRLELDEELAEFKGGILLKLDDILLSLNGTEELADETREKLDALMRHLDIYASYGPNNYTIQSITESMKK